MWIDVDPAAQLVRRGELDDRGPEDRRQDVRCPGDRQEDEGEREGERRQPERRDRQTPDDDGEDDRATDPPDDRHPAGQQGAEERPDRRCGRRAAPSPAGPTRKTSRARTGNSEVGIPKIIASRSMTNVARMTRRFIANLRPSRMAVSPGRITPPSGGSGASSHTATIEAPNVRTSTA